MSSSLQWEEISSSAKATACAIFLHGRGADGEDLMPLAEAFNLPALRFIFPHAPFDCPDLPGGRMWFGPAADGTPGMGRSQSLLVDLIKNLIQGNEENPGIKAEKIFLLGFSQGAVMSLDVGLRFPERLGGIAALSGFMSAPEVLLEEKSQASLKVPVILMHGTEDQVVKIEGSRRAYALLSSAGYDVKIKEYRMAHQIVGDEIALLRSEMIKHLDLSE